MNTGSCTPIIPLWSIPRVIQSVVPQLTFSFHRHHLIRADFSGGQITSDAGLLPLRAFDERHHMTRDWAACLRDPRQDDRVHHDALALLRQRIYQIVAGYEDANDAIRLRHDPLLQMVADQKLGDPLGSQPTLSRWENAPSGRDLVSLNDRLLEQFIGLCAQQVRQRGEILLDIDSTDDPTHGQQQLSFFNGAYSQHMYHPMLVFERHTGCLLAARLRPGNASSHARIVPMLLRLVPRLQSAFPGRADQAARRCRFRSAPALRVLRVLRHRVCSRHPRQLRLPAPRRTTTEAVKTALSPHPITPAQLFQLPPSRPQLVAPAPYLLQGRAHRLRNQPALSHHQRRWSRLRGLCFLQRSRRVREPH